MVEQTIEQNVAAIRRKLEQPSRPVLVAVSVLGWVAAVVVMREAGKRAPTRVKKLVTRSNLNKKPGKGGHA